jgi:ABC-type Fe3+-siderophore transport system permease subunit
MRENRMRAAATLAGMRAVGDDRYLGPLRRRRWRRGLVLAIAAVWAATLVGWFWPPVMLPFWGWVGTVPLTAVLLLLLTLATRNVASSVDAFVDEREREVRDRAHRLAYWAFGAPLGAVVGATHNLVHRRMADGTLTLTSGEVSGITAATVTVFLCYLLLPMALIAWTEPDRPEEDEDEEE